MNEMDVLNDLKLFGVKSTEKKKDLERKVHITTTIPYSIWENCQKKGLGWQFLLIRGYESLDAFDKLRERIVETETENKQMTKSFSKLQSKLWELQSKLDDLQKIDGVSNGN